jgi:hypothetical protein
VLGGAGAGRHSGGGESSAYSGQVEEFLTPVLMRMGKGDEPVILAQLRQSLRQTFGEDAEIVLTFMLKTYAHGGTEKLRALATARAAA